MAKVKALIGIETDIGNSDVKIKKLDREVNNVKKSATDTKSSLKGVGGAVSDLGGPLGQASSGVQTLGKAFMTLLASPIGIIVGLLAGIVALLSRLDPVVDKVEQGLDALTAIFDTLAGNLDKVGKLFMQIMTLDFSGATKTAQELGGAMGDAANEAIDLRKSIQALEDVQNEYTVSNAKAEVAVKNLLIQAKNVNLSYKEKIKILKEASKIEKEDYEAGLKIAEENARIAKAELARIDKAGTNRGDAAKAAADAEAALIRYKGQSADLQERIQNRIDAVNEAQAAKDKARKDQQEKEDKERAEREKKLNDEKLAYLRKGQGEYEAYLKEQQRLRDEALQNEINAMLLGNSQKQSLTEEEANKLLDIRKLTDAEIATLALLSVDKQIEYINKLKDANKNVLDEEIEARMAFARQLSGLLNTITNLMGQQSEEGKAIAAAATLIDTYVASFRAYKEGLKYGQVFAILSAAAAAATGLKAVQNILNTDAKGTNTTPSNTTASAPPPITRPSSSFVQLDNRGPLDVNNVGMTKVVVVESDITQVQNQVSSIKAKATIG
jgi:tetrahydromethanopterin S-methyltransferase subunit B